MTRQQPTVPRPEPIRARNVLTVLDGLLAVVRRHPLLTDAAAAAVVLAVSVPPVSAVAGRNQDLSLALLIAVVAPLVWRRRAPFLVFALMTGLALVQFFTTEELTDDLALLMAFSTIAAYQPPRRVLLAAAILEAGAAAIAASTTHPLPVGAILSGLVAAAGFLGYYTRIRRAYLSALVDRAERLERERDQQARLAAAAERVRIAREVHDIVAHNIAVMIALADGAAYTAKANPGQTVSLMGQVSATGRSALTEMRRMLGALHEPTALGNAPQPSLDDVEELIATVRTAGLPTRLTVTGQPFPLPPSAQLALYRMIQEALTNTLKHAPGATAQVRLTYLRGEVELEVADDGGPGAVPPVGPHEGGHGLVGMRERAALFGGQVAAGPRSGGGWRVRTVLRVDATPANDDTANNTDGTGRRVATEDV
jgi:signal transduction histidine kinase